MNCKKIRDNPMMMTEAPALDPRILVIGFGNAQRRDDGIGPYVIRQLQEAIGADNGVRFRSVSQLTIEMAEELYPATAVIFVDATVEALDGGWRCERLRPDTGPADFQTHHMRPDFLLGMVLAIYQQYPPAWLVAVQGEDFGFGREITPAARTRAAGAIGKIIETLESIRKKE
jgi:hydrogenase maturation protease